MHDINTLKLFKCVTELFKLFNQINRDYLPKIIAIKAVVDGCVVIELKLD